MYLENAVSFDSFCIVTYCVKWVKTSLWKCTRLLGHTNIYQYDLVGVLLL